MMEDIILPLFMCVVMPIAIVWLVMRTKLNETNKMAEIMLKAIETGTPLGHDLFKTQTQTFRKKSIKERLLGYLTAACILIGLGLCLIILGIIFCLVNNYTYETGPSVMILLPYFGGILFAVGAALLVVYFIRKKTLAKEIEEEEKALETPKEQ